MDIERRAWTSRDSRPLRNQHRLLQLLPPPRHLPLLTLVHEWFSSTCSTACSRAVSGLWFLPGDHQAELSASPSVRRHQEEANGQISMNRKRMRTCYLLLASVACQWPEDSVHLSPGLGTKYVLSGGSELPRNFPGNLRYSVLRTARS